MSTRLTPALAEPEQRQPEWGLGDGDYCFEADLSAADSAATDEQQ